MNWKTRKLFSDREHGIVSGLSPISMTGGGNVPYPSYQFGTGPGEAMAIDLFQQGDQDVNQALNMMSGSVSPSIADIGPTGPTGPTEMDQGPITETVEEISIEEGPSEYQVELQALKETFKNEIRSYVSQGGSEDLEKYLKGMSITYSNQLDDLKREYGVTEYSPEEELITEDFLNELQLLGQPEIPGFKEGTKPKDFTTQEELNIYFGPGVFTIDTWLGLDPAVKEMIIRRIEIGNLENTGVVPLDTTTLDDLRARREKLIPEMGRAAGAAYKTKEGGWGGFMGKLQAQRAGEALAEDKILAEQIAAEQALVSAAGRYGGKSGVDFTADAWNQILLKEYKDQETLNKAMEVSWNKIQTDQGKFGTGSPTRAMVTFMETWRQPPPYFTQYKQSRIFNNKPRTFAEYYAAAKKGWHKINNAKPEEKKESNTAYINYMTVIIQDWENLPLAK